MWIKVNASCTFQTSVLGLSIVDWKSPLARFFAVRIPGRYGLSGVSGCVSYQEKRGFGTVKPLRARVRSSVSGNLLLQPGQHADESTRRGTTCASQPSYSPPASSTIDDR